MAAAEATDRLYKFCEPIDVGDPRGLFAAVTGIFERFPVAVMEVVSDPVRGLPSRIRKPFLDDITRACDEAYAPIWRQIRRDRIEAERRRLLAPPPPGPKMTVAEIEAKLGRKLGKVLPEMPFAPVERRDDGHAARAIADLAGRKVSDGRSE